MGFRNLVNATGRNPDCEISPPRVTIHALPDEVLLKIFDFRRVAAINQPWRWSWSWTETWQSLVHVCQRWRYVVLSSPLGLDLHLSCTDGSPSVRKMLGVWPPLPIEIESRTLGNGVIIAALEHRDRVCNLVLDPASHSIFERLVTVMRNPFPALIQLRLTGAKQFGYLPVLPDTFLGGSAPHLRSLTLEHVVFPTLPQFLLSSNVLAVLCLKDFGYISPEAMATGLSALTRLTSVSIKFAYPVTRRPAMPPPLTRAVLPALTELHFRGFAGYLEDLLARIDTPQIKTLFIKLFQQSVINIRQVVSRSPSLGSFDCAMLEFDRSAILIQLDQSEGAASSKIELEIDHAPGRQLSSLVQICTQSSTLLSSVTKLNVIVFLSVDDEVLMSNRRWLVLFDSFAAARTLHFSGQILWFVVSLLGGLTRERAIEVLPKLENLYLRESDWRDEFEGPMKKFIAARQHSDHPVTWDLIASAS